jgi:hypothetical protein
MSVINTQMIEALITKAVVITKAVGAISDEEKGDIYNLAEAAPKVGFAVVAVV